MKKGFVALLAKSGQFIFFHEKRRIYVSNRDVSLYEKQTLNLTFSAWKNELIFLVINLSRPATRISMRMAPHFSAVTFLLLVLRVGHG